MSVYSSIILLHRPCLTAFDVDAESMAEKIAGWPNVAKAVAVKAYSDFDPKDKAADARIFRVGPVTDLKLSEADTIQWFDVDVPLMLPWLNGPREESILALIRSELDGALFDKVSTQTSLPPIPKVLVYGSGTAAKAAVEAVKVSGLDVVWAGANGSDLPDGIETLPCESLEKIHGWAGRFKVTLATNNGDSNIDVGAVVLAGSETRNLVENAASQSSMSLSAWAEEAIPKGNGNGILAFVCGVEKSTSIRNMERVLTGAIEALDKFSNQVYVFAPQIKVAGFGLERLYGRAREAGVVFIRTARTGPEIKTDSDGQITLTAYDPLAQADLKLTPNLVVWEDHLRPSPEPAQWGLPLTDDGFVGPDNILFLPSGTMRRGIFAIGPARGTDADETLAAEISVLASEITDVLEATEQEIIRHVNLCGRCLTCVRICPVGAIDITAESWFVPNACVACGLCASQCPAGAITLSGSSDRETSVRLKPLLDRPRTAEDSIPRVVLLGCERSVMQAMKTATAPDLPVDLIVSPIPCGCRADDTTVLKALAMGADGVLIGTCHPGNCRTDRGTEAVQARTAHVRRVLENLGFRTDRIGTISLAPNMGADFTKAITGYAAGLNGPAPAPENEEDVT
jgi:coenzyme F420-reducing hydrogenase delta subunit/NAD-dependent dihydropyrimidine dehydrogenase PreA subunit